MKYVLLFFMLPLQAPLFKTAVLVNNGSHICMFGDDHGTGAIETEQYKQLKDLLIERSKDKNKKPIHILLEKPQLFMEPDVNACILQQLSTLAREVPEVTVEDLENRATVHAAGALLKSNDPEWTASVHFDDGTGKRVDLRNVTYDDLFGLFDFRKKQIKKNLKRLNLIGDLFEARFEQADNFLEQMKKDLKHEGYGVDARIAAMSEVWKHVPEDQKRKTYFSNINNAFYPLFDLHALCRITELNERGKDVASFSGADHVDSIGYMLKHRGVYMFHKYPKYSSETVPKSPLDKQQLDIFDLQPTLWDSCYLRAQVCCAIQ